MEYQDVINLSLLLLIALLLTIITKMYFDSKIKTIPKRRKRKVTKIIDDSVITPSV